MAARKEEMKLVSLLRRAGYPASEEWGAVSVRGVTANSRRVTPGILFVAVRGSHVDGHDFIAEAEKRGCCAVVGEFASSRKHVPAAPFIAVSDSHAALGQLLAAYYDSPAEKMTLIGVTGTNGKTTVAYLVESILRQAGCRPGVLGTVNYRFGGEVRTAPLTTPAPEELHRLLRKMADGGVSHVVMEVSSHALDQGRLAGILFDVAAFTNLSRDHLDYHGSMESYYQSKLRLFTENLKVDGTAVVFEPWIREEAGFEEKAAWAARLKKDIAKKRKKTQKVRRIITSGGAGNDVQPEKLCIDLTGISGAIRTPSGSVALRASLVGSFNVNNLLAAAGIGCALKIDPAVIARGLAAVRGVPGRLERVKTGKDINVFVDYAHTPDALDNVLTTLRALGDGRLVAVFGCGGDRDRGKRPQMGLIAATRADAVIVTSDNPRSESAANIIDDIVAGISNGGLQRQRAELFLQRGWRGFFDVVVDRRLAIRTAVLSSLPGDILLIAGKGHEDYQLIDDRKIHFDDRLEAVSCLGLWHGADRSL